MKATFTATVPGVTATQNDHEGLAFPWTGTYRTGKSADGVPYVVAPNAIDLNPPSPAPTSSPRITNGVMFNPVPMSQGGIKQAFDVGGGTEGDVSGSYDASRTADFSAVARPGDVLVKTIGNTANLGSTGRNGIIQTYAGLHVVSAPPPANAFAAPFLWPVADKANRPWREVDLDARLSELPSYSAAGQSVTTWASVAPHFNAFDLGRAVSQSDSTGGYENWTRYNSTPGGVNASNYGRNLVNIQAQVLLGLMSAGWSYADKTAALIRLLQQGCQFGEAIVADPAATVTGLGGHDQGTYAACMAWLWATGRQAQYSTWSPKISGTVRNQYYFITASMLANDFVPHSDPAKPYPYRRRNVLSVSGTSVSMQGFIPVGGVTEDSSSNGTFTGLDLVKESNGNSAEIISTTQGPGNPGSWNLTLAAPISGLAVNDVVFCRARYTLTDGMGEWTERLSQVSFRNPSPIAAYRNLNCPTASRMFARAIGMYRAEMAPGEAYMERANAGLHALPTQIDDSPIGSANPPWVRQFYDANWATLKALPQSG